MLILTPMAVRPGPAARRASARPSCAPRSLPPTSVASRSCSSRACRAYYPQFGFGSATRARARAAGRTDPRGRPGWRCRSRAYDPALAAASSIPRSSRRLRMPELPEVETVRRAIAPVLEGRMLAHVEIDDVRLTRPEDPLVVAAELQGERVEHVDRRGKYLIVRFASGRALLIHLRMTGSLLREPRQALARPRRPHARRRDGSRLPRRPPLRHLASARARRARAVPRRAPRRRAARRRVHREGPGRAAGRSPRAAQGGAPRPADARRAREHLRRRGALVRAPEPAPARALARPRRAPPPAPGDQKGARARDRPAGVDAHRLSPARRQLGIDADGVQGLRAHGRAVRPLRHAVREDARRRPRDVVLPALPARRLSKFPWRVAPIPVTKPDGRRGAHAPRHVSVRGMGTGPLQGGKSLEHQDTPGGGCRCGTNTRPRPRLLRLRTTSARSRSNRRPTSSATSTARTAGRARARTTTRSRRRASTRTSGRRASGSRTRSRAAASATTPSRRSSPTRRASRARRVTACPARAKGTSR